MVITNSPAQAHTTIIDRSLVQTHLTICNAWQLLTGIYLLQTCNTAPLVSSPPSFTTHSAVSLAHLDDFLEVPPGLLQGVHGEPGVGVGSHLKGLYLLVQGRQLVEVGQGGAKGRLELVVGLPQGLADQQKRSRSKASWMTTLIKDYLNWKPPWGKTSLVKKHPGDTTTLRKDHPGERLPWWKTTLLKKLPDDERPLMKVHPAETPPWWWKTTDESPPCWNTSLMMKD